MLVKGREPSCEKKGFALSNKGFRLRAMAEKGLDHQDLESQARLLIELGEPEAWLETMLRHASREALHAAAEGHEQLANRWRRLAKSLDYASAANSVDPISEAAPGNAESQSPIETTAS